MIPNESLSLVATSTGIYITLKYCEVSFFFFYSLGDVKSLGEAEEEQCDGPIMVEEIIYSIEH